MKVRRVSCAILCTAIATSSYCFAGFWGISDTDNQADATAPAPAPVATPEIRPGDLTQKMVIGISNMNTEVVNGNNGVFGYSLSYGLTDRVGISGGLGIFPGNFKKDDGTTTYETRGWFVPLQLNLQYGLISDQDLNLSIFGGANYVYGTSKDKLSDSSTGIVYFEESSRANVYGAQIGLTAEKTLGVLGLSGFVMLQGLTGDVNYPSITFRIRDTYILHGTLEVYYLPFGVGLSLYHQRDFNGKGNVTSLNVTYNF